MIARKKQSLPDTLKEDTLKKRVFKKKNKSKYVYWDFQRLVCGIDTFTSSMQEHIMEVFKNAILMLISDITG